MHKNGPAVKEFIVSIYIPLFGPQFFTLSIFFFWLYWVFVAVCGFSLVAVTGGYSLVAVNGLLNVAASFVAEHGLSVQFSSVQSLSRV